MAPFTSTSPPVRRPRSLAMLAAVGLAALVGAACSPPEAEEVTVESCTTAPSASTATGPVIAVLTDGASPATTQALSTIAEDPAALFGTEVPGFVGGTVPDDAEAGIVMLLTYGPTGAIETVGDYDLRGTGEDSTVRAASARRTARCLEVVASGLAPAPPAAVPPGAGSGGAEPVAETPLAAPGGDLLRALGPTRDVVLARSGGNPAAIVAVGLGRSQVAGVPLSLTDLRDQTRPEVLAQIVDSGVHIADLRSSGGVGLVFLAPDESITNSVSSAGLAAFALDLCDATGAAPCGRTTALGAPVEGP